MGSRGDRQHCQCSEQTGRNDQLGTRRGQGRTLGAGRGQKGSVLVLTDNIERVNQRVKLIPHALQGVADHLGAVQELDAVGVGLVLHREGPLDVRRVAPAWEEAQGWVQGRGPQYPSYSSPFTQEDQHRLMSPLGRVSTFPAPLQQWLRSLLFVKKTMSLPVALCGLYQTGGHIKLVTSMAIARHSLLQFPFQKKRPRRFRS